jgi:hypothetical protein
MMKSDDRLNLDCARILERLRQDKELVQLEDGFWYYHPSPMRGVFGAWVLRIIADEMDRLNKDWQDQLTEEMRLAGRGDHE